MKKIRIYCMSKISKLFCLLFLLIALPKFAFAVYLSDNWGVMTYEDIINIQKDRNLLKYQVTYDLISYYRLEIPDAVQQCLNEEVSIMMGNKSDRGYVFDVKGGSSYEYIGTFELVHLQNKCLEFFDFSTIKVILSELLQKSEEELDELCAQHIEKTGRRCKTLPLQYYLALDILSEDYKNKYATEKLKQFQIEASMHPEFVFGGSLISMNKGIRLLLEKYKIPEKILEKDDKALMKEKIKQFYENALNNGTDFPYKYYELLKDVSIISNKYNRRIKKEAEYAIELTKVLMGGSILANKKIRELLWQVLSKKLDMDHLLNEDDEDACNEINKIINLLKNDYYKKWAKKLLIRNANQMFESWVDNIFADNSNYLRFSFSRFDFPRLALLLLPYNDKPEELPDSTEEYCLLTYHAMVTQNNAQIENLRKLAEDAFAKMENIGVEHFDIENHDHLERICTLFVLSPLVPEHKITLRFYSLLIDMGENRDVYNFFKRIFDYMNKNPDVMMGQSLEENIAIRIIVNEAIRKFEEEGYDDQYSDDEVNVDSNASDGERSDEEKN